MTTKTDSTSESKSSAKDSESKTVFLRLNGLPFVREFIWTDPDAETAYVVTNAPEGVEVPRKLAPALIVAGQRLGINVAQVVPFVPSPEDSADLEAEVAKTLV